MTRDKPRPFELALVRIAGLAVGEHLDFPGSDPSRRGAYYAATQFVARWAGKTFYGPRRLGGSGTYRIEREA